MRTVIPILILTTVLAAGCITKQTRADLAAAKKAVAQLEVAVAQAEASQAANLAELKAQLSSAQAKLLEVEAKAATERKTSGADVAEGVQTFSPILAGAFPGAGVLFGLLGVVAGAIKDKLRKVA